jgi:RecB family endonuclease NucS
MCKKVLINYEGDNHVSNLPLAILVNPDAEDANRMVEEALHQRRLLLVVGRCSVRYVGRAESKLEPGERMLIIKEDGSLLVHRSTGYEPVNWQPPGCVYHSQAKNGVLEIHAVRHRPSESVKVTFDRIFFASGMDLADSGKFTLHASEEDMHKAILASPSLLEEGFKPVSYEKKVDPGFLDVYGQDNKGRLVVVEVKRKTAGKQAAIQLAKYVDSIRERTDRQVRGVLAAPDIAKGVQTLLSSLSLEFRRLDPKKCAETLQQSKAAKLATFFKENEIDNH